MLGWKLGTAYRTYTKIKALETYGALYRQVASAHGDHEAQRLKELSGSSAAAVASVPPGAHATAVVMASVGSPAAAAEAGPPAHPPQHVGSVDHPPQLLAHPIVPGVPAPQLANIAHIGGPSSQAVEVRGMCDGCGQYVMSDDEGRLREGTKYFHLGCILGHCGHCGRIVHADADRVKVRGLYFHRDCQ